MFRNLLHKQEHFNTWGIKNNFIDDPISAFKFEKKFYSLGQRFIIN